MTQAVVALALLVLLELVALRFGADSRDGRDWAPRSPR